MYEDFRRKGASAQPMFERQTATNTFSTVPSRDLCFILDPACVPQLSQPMESAALDLIRDLSKATPGIFIRCLLPTYLQKVDIDILQGQLGDQLFVFGEEKGVEPFLPNEKLPKQDRERLAGATAEQVQARTLIALAEAAQADGIVTNSATLVGTRWSLRQSHRVRIIPVAEFGDILEICAHGHMLFWSAKNADRNTIVDTYYPTRNEKCFRYFKWMLEFSKSCENKVLKNELHSALVNRYPFLLYARDMVRFYELQLDHFWRRGMIQRFIFPLGYHVTHFYLLLWGMLEQLTVIAKHQLTLQLNDRECGIRKPKFWKQVATSKPQLRTFVQTDRVSEWIGHMADMRHSAAHQTIPLPTMVMQDTEESRKSDSEIREELKRKYHVLYSFFGEDYMRKIEPEMIVHWRVEKMKALFSTSVLIKTPGEGGYFRDPVASIDYDLAMLTEVLDAFLRELFGFNADLSSK